MAEISSYGVPEFPTVEDLRSTRETFGLSQAAVAEEMGVSSRTVSHYETGRREITLEQARVYADALRALSENGN